MARPSALAPERRERIESALEDGIPIAIVGQNVGVGRSTIHAWLKDGAIVRRRRPDPLELVPKNAVAESASSVSSDSLEERLRAAEPGLVAVLVNAAQRGSWQSAAWLLERIDPSRWAKPSRTRSLEERPACRLRTIPSRRSIS